mgnify:CR=1 FL=1
MKGFFHFKTVLIPALVAVVLVFSAPPARSEGDVSISVFHDRLASPGRWVSSGSY